MENFLTILISFYLGKYSDKINSWVMQQIFKFKFIKKKNKNYNDFYECTFKEKDFEKGE